MVLGIWQSVSSAAETPYRRDIMPRRQASLAAALQQMAPVNSTHQLRDGGESIRVTGAVAPQVVFVHCDDLYLVVWPGRLSIALLVAADCRAAGR